MQGRLTIRMSDQLHERLKAIAWAEHRTLNGEVVKALEAHVEAHDREDKAA